MCMRGWGSGHTWDTPLVDVKHIHEFIRRIFRYGRLIGLGSGAGADPRGYSIGRWGDRGWRVAYDVLGGEQPTSRGSPPLYDSTGACRCIHDNQTVVIGADIHMRQGDPKYALRRTITCDRRSQR